MKWSALIVTGLLGIAWQAGLSMAQQYHPSWELRTFLGPGPGAPNPTAVYTDTSGSGTWQYNMSKVRGRWVCPRCGYSTATVHDPANPPYCPNPWMVSGHGNVRLRYQPPKQCFLSTTAVPVTNPSGQDVLALIGKPFHPRVGSVEEGSAVHIAVAGLQNSRDVTADDANGDFVRFLVLMPGAKFPAARAEIDSANNGLGLNDDDIHLNPYRVTDGEEYYVQFWETTDYAGGVPQVTYTAVRVYSTLDGIVFFGFAQTAGAGGIGEVRVITATGSAIIDVPDINPPDPPPGGGFSGRRTVTEYTHFTVHSNARIVPGLGEDPTSDPPNWGNVPGQWNDPTPNPVNDWPIKHSFFRIPSNGRVADWLTRVVGSGQPVQEPYVIPQAATGKGTVWALWQAREASEGGTGGYNGIIDNPNDNQLQTIGGVKWWWDEGAEWNYDWLEEGSSAGAYERLWGNCRAIANGTDLEPAHTPNGGLGYLDSDPPWQVKCSFISSRVRIPPTGDQWQHGSVTEPAELDTDPNCGHAVVVVGEALGGVVWGSYQPGARTPNRAVRIDSRRTMAVRCSGCGSTLAPGTNACPYCGQSVQRNDGYLAFCVDLDKPLGIDLPQSPRSGQPAHVTIPDTALEVSPQIGWYSPGDLDRRFTLAFNLPKYLPPSVPPGSNPAINDFDSDRGYRGRLVAFHRPYGVERTPDLTGQSPGLQVNWRWDAAYRCPACGAWQNSAGNCANGSCQGTRICPVCMTVARPSQTDCPFCGRSMKLWSGSTTFAGLPRVTEEDLDCEEYEPFEVVVSVFRKLDLAAKIAAVDLGRVAPGVPTGFPDTTVGAAPVAKPEPSDVSPASESAVINEGNVGAAAALRGTNLNRSDVDTSSVSRDYEAGRYPLTVGTIYAAGVGGVQITDAAPLAMPTQEPGGAEGHSSAAWLQAGWLLPISYKPVPLGQPAGTHTGQAVFFYDLNGNGALDFYDVSAGQVTNSNAATYDPVADLPLEPVASMDVRLRVAESPVPDNDYFAPDFAPSIAFGYDNNWWPNSFQLVFSSQRPPGPAIGAAGGHYTAPPADANEARARASQPANLFYLYATKATDPSDPLYQGYLWRSTGPNIESAHTLTADDVAGTSNTSPDAVDRRFVDHNWVTAWHRAKPTSKGWELTLRANISGSIDYSSAGETFMFTGRLVKGLRLLAGPGQPTAFWHSGEAGQERIYYLIGFDPAHPRDGTELPVTMSYSSRPHDERAVVWLSGDAVGSIIAHRPSRSPFAYTKDPCAWVVDEYLAGGGSDQVLNVVFSGFVRAQGNADICWVKFRRSLLDQPSQNWGKKAFPRLEGRLPIPQTSRTAGEEMTSDVHRQTFLSQHLDWVVHDVSPTDNFGRAPDPTRQDPRLYLAVVTDTPGDHNPPAVSLYGITWTHNEDRWDRTRNAYFVEPRFVRLEGPDVLAPLYIDGSAPSRLIDPATARQSQPRPLLMEINPAAGMVRFSSPLFNTEAPNDPTAVINTSAVANATDVVMFIDYTPMIWRISTDPADDDCPWAYWVPHNGYIAFFWRRTYPVADAPHWGRSSFVYKLWAPSVSVRTPPIQGTPTVTASDILGRPRPGDEFDVHNNWTVVLRRMRVNELPWVVTVTYNSGAVTERRLAPGWTRERRVEIDTELMSGPFTVRPEPANVTAPSGQTMEVPRFWLVWSSPRALLDLRSAASGGGALRQTSDIFTAVVVPDVNSAVAELPQSTIPTDPT
ncbi:MAG: zinc ribbon domain-containing protein [Armatimonadetes bacterium]|nr:zinc ribbon domain-containing protein [Armatimonadota bacterium]